MSKPKSRNTLLSSHNRSSYGNNIKDELISMKYQMDKPEVPIYMLNDSAGQEKDAVKRKEPEYPDFHPWKDHTELVDSKKEKEVQKMSNASYLNKGYYEIPHVTNEYHSARNLIQATLFSSTSNCNNVLSELSQHLANAYKTRNEGINKIKYESNKFKVITRVTLTASKKEAWIRDLANPKVPLSRIADKLPHGIRNKVLIDLLSTRNVPILRGIWFTKLVLYSEYILQKKKHHSRSSTVHSPSSNNLDLISSEKFESVWMQEWTQQVVDYIYKVSREMAVINSAERKSAYLNKFNYVLSYSQALYIEGLLDKNFFLTSNFHFLKEGLPQGLQNLTSFSRMDADSEDFSDWVVSLSSNYGQKLVSLTIVKAFWNDIIKIDYLCKELSELLLLNYFFIQKMNACLTKVTPSHSKTSIPQDMIKKLSELIANCITYLFKHNTNHFIIPNYWTLLNEPLYKILLGDSVKFEDETEQVELQKQLQLINYRNESLMLNKMQLQSHPASGSPQKNMNIRGNASGANIFSSLYSANSPSKFPNQDQIDDDYTFINRGTNDILKTIDQLDKLKLSDELAETLKPYSTTTSVSQNWKMNLRLIIFWCITPFRVSIQSKENILIICNFLKRKVLQVPTTKSSNIVKIEFENEILEIIYDIVENSNINIIEKHLYVLINELYQLKIITISAYLRKLIASGIFYASPGSDLSYSSQVDVHLSILKNLPVLNNKQCNSILKKWTSEGYDFQTKFDIGKRILQSDIVDKFINDDLTSFGDELKYFEHLNVGLQFLLINWLTNELKSSISKSSKLVHLNPSVLSLLYEFYSSCDNLTIFFKVLVRSLLKNEGKMLIFYMDSLYLISRLVINHFKLIKCIAGTSQDSLSTGYELFKLILVNYKDLASRDSDIPQFQNVWKFINIAVESNSSVNKPEKFDRQGQKTAFFDSPLKIAPAEGKYQEAYSFKDFKSDLEVLANQPAKLLTSQQIEESFALFNLDYSSESYHDPSQIKTNIQTQIKAFFDILSIENESERQTVSRLILDIKQILGKEFSDIFSSQLREYIKSNHIERRTLLSFLKNICVYEILTVDVIPSSLKEWDEYLDRKWSEYYFDFLFSEKDGNFDLPVYHRIIFESMLNSYLQKYSSNLVVAFLEDAGRSNDDNLNCYSMVHYSDFLIMGLRQALTHNSKYVIDELMNKIPVESALRLSHLMLNLGTVPKICTFNDLCEFATIFNEFNLPIVQLLMKILFNIESSNSEDRLFKDKVEKLLDGLLTSMEYQFSSHNSYFGELFNYLHWEHKVQILNILESKFLIHTLFNLEADDDEFICLSDSTGRSLLPVLKDYFKKFSLSSINTVPTTKDFYERISNFLCKLLSLVNLENFEDKEKALYNTISIFLRILIIHKLTLSQAIVNVDPQLSFVKNLIFLLKSSFVNQNEKLKILLYDLLHLTKTSLTLEMTMKSEILDSPNDPNTGQSPMKNSNSQSKPTSDVSLSVNNDSPASLASHIASIFNLPEPNKVNPLKGYLKDHNIGCALMLTDEELERSGDIHNVNNYGLVLTSPKKEQVSLSSDFGLIESSGSQQKVKEFRLRGFEILEDTSSSLNDGYINLSLFDAYTTKENPP